MSRKFNLHGYILAAYAATHIHSRAYARDPLCDGGSKKLLRKESYLIEEVKRNRSLELSLDHLTYNNLSVPTKIIHLKLIFTISEHLYYLAFSHILIITTFPANSNPKWVMLFSKKF